MVRAGLLALFIFIQGCASSQGKKAWREAHHAFYAQDYTRAEQILKLDEVAKDQDQLARSLLSLASISLIKGDCSQAVEQLSQAREVIERVRSDAGGFTFGLGPYASNPIEFSYVHFALSVCREIIAEKQKSDPLMQRREWDRVLAELRAWDSFIEAVKRSRNIPVFAEDPFSRYIASVLHARRDQKNEQQTSRILRKRTQELLLQYESEFAEFQDKKITPTSGRNLFLLEKGGLPELKKKIFRFGLGFLNRHIEDASTRAQIDRIGLEVIFQTAPEFGVLLLGGAALGAASADSEDAPVSFLDAADRGLGIEVQVPHLPKAPRFDEKIWLKILDADLKPIKLIELMPLFPIQDWIARELKLRGESELFPKAMKVAAQYLAILIPAVIAYQDAVKKESLLGRLAALAGFAIAKKAIDRMNQAEDRIWSFLPQTIFANDFSIQPGIYRYQVVSKKNEQDHLSEKVLVETQECVFDASGKIQWLRVP